MGFQGIVPADVVVVCACQEYAASFLGPAAVRQIHARPSATRVVSYPCWCRTPAAQAIFSGPGSEVWFTLAQLARAHVAFGVTYDDPSSNICYDARPTLDEAAHVGRR